MSSPKITKINLFTFYYGHLDDRAFLSHFDICTIIIHVLMRRLNGTGLRASVPGNDKRQYRLVLNVYMTTVCT